MNESESPMNASRAILMSKPGTTLFSGISQPEDCRLGWWHPAYRWHDPYSGGFAQLREPSAGMKSEKAQGFRMLRPKVAMPCDGTDWVVRAMSAGNAAGAKDPSQKGNREIQLATGGNFL